MFDLDQQLHQPTYGWQYCSQRQPSADCYGLLLDEGLKEKKKKIVPLQAKEDEQSGSKATAARESWCKHQEHFTSYAGVTGQQETVRLYLAGQFLQVSSDWRPPHQKRRDLVVLKCHAPQNKSTPHTIDPNNKNVITIKFVTKWSTWQFSKSLYCNSYFLYQKKHIHSTWFHSGFFFIRSHLPPTLQQHSYHWEPTQNQRDEF